MPTAPPAVVARIKRYDPQLEVKWNNAIERWQLGRWRPFSQVLDYVCTVANDDGSYRPLDDRIFEKLDAGDLAKKRWQEIVRSVDDHNQRVRDIAWKSGEAGRRWYWKKAYEKHVLGRSVVSVGDKGMGRG